MSREGMGFGRSVKGGGGCQNKFIFYFNLSVSTKIKILNEIGFEDLCGDKKKTKLNMQSKVSIGKLC